MFLKKINKIFNIKVKVIVKDLRQVLNNLMNKIAPGIYIYLDNIRITYNADGFLISFSLKVFRNLKI